MRAVAPRLLAVAAPNAVAFILRAACSALRSDFSCLFRPDRSCVGRLQHTRQGDEKVMQIWKPVQSAAAGLSAIVLAGCVVNVSDSGSDRADAVPPPPVPMKCDAAPAQSYVGRDATQSVGETIVAASGARSMRWGPPNAAWTMDYREDRVNVRYDAKMKIIEITCG